jgi:thioredoxin 1
MEKVCLPLVLDGLKLSSLYLSRFLYLQVIKPVYESLSKENTDVAFGLVDVDDNSDASLEFEIKAVPTFVFFHGEKAVERLSGADSNMLKKNIESLKAR